VISDTELVPEPPAASVAVTIDAYEPGTVYAGGDICNGTVMPVFCHTLVAPTRVS